MATGLGKPEVADLILTIRALEPLHTRLEVKTPDDWLATHTEPGQTFLEYIQSNPATPAGNRRVIYVQPIGEFTSTLRQILSLTSDYLARYFNLKVEVNDRLPLSIIPRTRMHLNAQLGIRQIHTGYVLSSVLRPRLRDDGAALIRVHLSRPLARRRLELRFRPGFIE